VGERRQEQNKYVMYYQTVMDIVKRNRATLEKKENEGQ
jgi:hypothetical protein